MDTKIFILRYPQKGIVTTNPSHINPSRIAVIRTSDRIAYKACRRKWNWSSHLRQNLTSKELGAPLWLGSAMHYALEDYHGINRYGSPDISFRAYTEAFDTTYPGKVPMEWPEQKALGIDMMKYYVKWLEDRDPLETYVHNGELQTEVTIKIEIPIDELRNADRIRQRYDEVWYTMILDRVIIDEYDQLWLVEYKSAKAISTTHLLLDPQIGVYVWGMRHKYTKPIAGIIYQQHKKARPSPGRILKNGEVSTAQMQATTHRLYRASLVAAYGLNSSNWPIKNVQYLNALAREESEHSDEFIRRDFIQRNLSTGAAIEQQILDEASEMLDPDLPIYPNQTRMCVQMCSFTGPCASMDDGGDWGYNLKFETEPRATNYDEWRANLPEPQNFIRRINT